MFFDYSIGLFFYSSKNYRRKRKRKMGFFKTAFSKWAHCQNLALNPI